MNDAQISEALSEITRRAFEHGFALGRRINGIRVGYDYGTSRFEVGNMSTRSRARAIKLIAAAK